jgi:hypothetical protein
MVCFISACQQPRSRIKTTNVAHVLAWVNSNWFSVVQSVGILGGLGGLWFTAGYFREDTQARREQANARREANREQKVSNILAFSARHQSLWADTYQHEDLKRILHEQVDLASHPATPIEIEYLRQLAPQLQAGWEIAVLSKPDELEPLALDLADFFSRPLPHFVWKKVKKFRHPKFVEFVERAMGESIE